MRSLWLDILYLLLCFITGTIFANQLRQLTSSIKPTASDVPLLLFDWRKAPVYIRVVVKDYPIYAKHVFRQPSEDVLVVLGEAF